MTYQYKLSIITVNLNDKAGLIKTIQSVVAQTFTNFEYLVIDGASTDGSVEIIKQYQKNINYWVSEPDYGIYNAMNKGIQQAKGEYLLFLNSGDWLTSNDILSRVFANPKNVAIIYGDVLLNGAKKKFPKHITFAKLLTHTCIHHQASFLKRQLFDKYGLYNENLKIVADWEFIFKALTLHKVSYYYNALPIANFSLEGISTQSKLQNKTEKEQVLKEHYQLIIEQYLNLDAQYQSLVNSRFIKPVLFLKKLLRK